MFIFHTIVSTYSPGIPRKPLSSSAVSGSLFLASLLAQLPTHWVTYSIGVAVLKSEPLVSYVSKHELKPEAGEPLLFAEDVMERSPHPGVLQLPANPPEASVRAFNAMVRICPVHPPLKEL